LLQLHELDYHLFLEKSPESVVLIADGKCVYANQSAANLLGLDKPEDLIGQDMLDFVSSLDVEGLRSIIEGRAKGEKQPLRYEFKLRRIDGSEIDAETHVTMINFEGRSASLAYIRDLTEGKQLENQMRVKLEVLHRHAVNLVNMNSIVEAMEYSFDIIDELLGFSNGAIGIVEEDYLKFIYTRNVSSDVLPEMPLSGKGITVRAVKTGKTQLIHDTRLDHDYVKDIDEPDKLSELDVPVKIGGKVIAVINLESEQPNAFTKEDKEIVEILSEHLASAISRIEQLKAIKASEEEYRMLLDSSLDSVVLLSDTKILYANSNMAKLLCYDSASELIGQDISITLADEEKELVRQRTTSRQRGEPQPDRYELKLLRKDGKIVEAETVVSLIEYKNKPAVLALSRDVTERNRYERQVMALHRHAAALAQAGSYDEICKATLDAIESVIGFHLLAFMVVREEGLISIGNRGSPPLDRVLPLDGPGVTVKAAREQRSILVKDTRLEPDFVWGPTDSLSELTVPIVVDGQTVGVINMESIELNAFNEMDQKLLETLVMHVSTTIINLRSQEKIKRNIEELERSNRDLDDYTYVVSHDLKAPLRTIKSFSSFLLEDLGDRLDETEKDYLNRIDAAATNMDRLIEDLLLLSRVGRKFTNVEPVDLNVLLEEIRNDQVAVIDEKKAELIVDDLPTIEVQRIWMKQLFANLVNNGLKFNKSPSPKVVVSSVTDDENYLFSVKDNGIGIDGKYHSQIFKIFERLNSTEEYKGTGAGLAISKKIVEYIGGKIWLESEPGVGSVFYFTIPKKKPIRSGSE